TCRSVTSPATRYSPDGVRGSRCRAVVGELLGLGLRRRSRASRLLRWLGIRRVPVGAKSMEPFEQIDRLGSGGARWDWKTECGVLVQATDPVEDDFPSLGMNRWVLIRPSLP